MLLMHGLRLRWLFTLPFQSIFRANLSWPPSEHTSIGSGFQPHQIIGPSMTATSTLTGSVSPKPQKALLNACYRKLLNWTYKGLKMPCQSPFQDSRRHYSILTSLPKCCTFVITDVKFLGTHPKNIMPVIWSTWKCSVTSTSHIFIFNRSLLNCTIASSTSLLFHTKS